MNKLKISESELYKRLDKWIGQNVDVVEKAQNISKKINDANLLHIFRSLPFEILPIDDEVTDFKLIIYLDHPSFDTIEININKTEIYVLDDCGVKNLLTEKDVDDLINQNNDENNSTYINFVDSVSNRNYTQVNKIINIELANYRNKIDPKIKEIKNYLKSIENVGLTNPKDGTVSYLNRVMGRWDLALCWEVCPFVVISNSELTEEVEKTVENFKIFEKKAAALLNTMQKTCLSMNMDVQVITDSKENEADASGWLSIDKFGVPQIGPLLHVVKINVYSILEGNVRKESGYNSKLLIK